MWLSIFLKELATDNCIEPVGEDWPPPSELYAITLLLDKALACVGVVVIIKHTVLTL